MNNLPLFLLYSPMAPFVRPYFERQFPDYTITERLDSDFKTAVMVSGTDVYNAASGTGHDENTAILPRHSILRLEDNFIRACRQRNIAPTILRCPHIIGTGMTGLPREMVNKIHRGTFFHIKGVEEHLSVVHASDIALAASCCMNSGKTLIVTDGADPSYSELAEALAFRLDQKRIFTIGERWARWRYNSALYNTLTNTLTFSSRRLQDEFGFTPTPVCRYLTTHIYNDESL
ncbi:MAG: hypothetical protein K2L80_08830 [Muribaculaceae bacterium]|nr:hypothetical protein [Muribaculaceae bacterium]MDE6332693.1 hypothetical protein [Muribaculaceae bacterium]